MFTSAYNVKCHNKAALKLKEELLSAYLFFF